jgi:hypothetical protein
MTVRELVEECNQFIADDACKLRVGSEPSATNPVAVRSVRWVKRLRLRLDALEKRVSEAATRYFARAGK